MELRIEILKEKKLIGKHVVIGLANNWTGELWKSFMPRRKEINNTVSTNLIFDGYLQGRSFCRL